MKSGGSHRRICNRLIPTVMVAGNRTDRGNGVTTMTAIVSREHARTTWLTGAAGVLLLGVAFVMMVVAAPAQVHHRPHGPAQSPATQVTTDLCRRLMPRSDSTRARACPTGPSALSTWAEAYPPAMIAETWSATSSGRTALSPLPRPASSAVS